MSRGDAITIVTGSRIKHTTVRTAIANTGWFRVEWRGRAGGVSSRTLLTMDSGLRWLPGHLDVRSQEAQALICAQAIVGESPWKAGTANGIRPF